MKYVLVFLSSLALWSGSKLVAGESEQLSLVQALKDSVERNLDIKLERINVDAKAIELDLTRAIYEPAVTNNTSHQSYDAKPANIFEGEAEDIFTQENTTLDVGLQKMEDFGLSWSVDWSNQLRDSTSGTSFGESYFSTLSVGVEQKLLQGFAFDPEIPRKDEYVARGNLDMSRMDLSVKIMEILQKTENAYWDLVQSIEDLKVKQNSLKLAQQLYEQNKIKIEVGTLAPIELASAEATVASREAEIVSAENAVVAAEDQLKQILNLPPEQWSVRLIPVDEPAVEALDPDLDDSLRVAFDHRPEIQKDALAMENALLEFKARKNETLPELNLRAAYFLRGASNPVVNPQTGIVSEGSSYGDALSEVTGLDLPGYQVSLDLTWHPLNKQAKLNLARADITLRQQEVYSEQIKIGIREEVRSALRELKAYEKVIKANEKARRFKEENLKAEVQKFQNGLSTNFEVSQVQDELAQGILDEIQARINYRKSMVSYFKALGTLLNQRNIALD